MGEKLLNKIWKKVQEIDGIKEDLSGVKADVSGLKKDINGVKDDVNGIKDDVSGLKDGMGGLKKDIGFIKNKVYTLEENQKVIKTFMENVEDSLLSQKQLSKQMSDDIDQIKEDVNFVRKVAGKNMADIADLKSQGEAV